MPVITAQDVIDIYPPAAESPTALIDALIETVSEADPCLSNYSEAQARIVKALAVAHLMVEQSGGQITQDRSPTGASVSYAAPEAKQGLSGTQFGRQLLGLPAGRCIQSLLDRPQAFAVSVGGVRRGRYRG